MGWRVGGTNSWIRQAQGFTLQHGEHSQYSVTTLNGV